MGPTQEPAEHELRQAVAFDPAVLQERHHPEAPSKQPSSLPVQRQVQKRLSLFDPFHALQQSGNFQGCCFIYFNILHCKYFTLFIYFTVLLYSAVFKTFSGALEFHAVVFQNFAVKSQIHPRTIFINNSLPDNIP